MVDRKVQRDRWFFGKPMIANLTVPSDGEFACYIISGDRVGEFKEEQVLVVVDGELLRTATSKWCEVRYPNQLEIQHIFD